MKDMINFRRLGRSQPSLPRGVNYMPMFSPSLCVFSPHSPWGVHLYLRSLPLSSCSIPDFYHCSLSMSMCVFSPEGSRRVRHGGGHQCCRARARRCSTALVTKRSSGSAGWHASTTTTVAARINPEWRGSRPCGGGSTQSDGYGPPPSPPLTTATKRFDPSGGVYGPPPSPLRWRRWRESTLSGGGGCEASALPPPMMVAGRLDPERWRLRVSSLPLQRWWQGLTPRGANWGRGVACILPPPMAATRGMSAVARATARQHWWRVIPFFFLFLKPTSSDVSFVSTYENAYFSSIALSGQKLVFCQWKI
jgi:hypothetical protein